MKTLCPAPVLAFVSTELCQSPLGGSLNVSADTVVGESQPSISRVRHTDGCGGANHFGSVGQ